MNRELGRVVVLLAHPQLQTSVANNELANVAKEMDNVIVHNLYDEVDAAFDVDEWSRALTYASALVLQFPFHWMSAPYMLKRWQDEVLTHLARTPAIAGKPMQLVVTAGSECSAYRSGGMNRFTIDELLRPYQASAILSGMTWETPIIVYGIGNEDSAKNIARGAIQYKKTLEELLRERRMMNTISW